MTPTKSITLIPRPDAPHIVVAVAAGEAPLCNASDAGVHKGTKPIKPKQVDGLVFTRQCAYCHALLGRDERAWLKHVRSEQSGRPGGAA